ncbi:ATP-binding cassette domain-containing protein [Candidatus Puniceispirillum sp.]|nr:ATP-binding cassette domain-containing protein [Candidatus Puniceispirillum sp.]
MLAVNALDVDINGTPILRDIGLEINLGEIIGLIGRNGAGKTTFLRSIMGLLPIVDGTIRFGEEELNLLPGYKRAHMGFGYMPEDRRLVPEMTSEQNILVPVWSTGIEDYMDRLNWIYKIIPECEKFKEMPATSLSGGQQKLVALARALMVGKTLLLLDEPTEGIAPVLAQRMGEILASLKKEGVSILIAESNDAHVADVIDRTYVIERGSIVES